MEHPIVALFKPILETQSRSDAISYLLQHPVLTLPYYTELLNAWAARLETSQQQSALRLLALRNEVWDQLGSGKLKLSEEHNLILNLALSVVQGKVTEAYACQVASRPEFFVELIYPMLANACALAEKLVLKNWRPVVSLMRVMFAALDARRLQIPENQQGMDLTTVETWLAVATSALWDVPDGRIYHDAVRRGEAFADIVDPTADPPGNILHRLGTLHIDPYLAGRSSQQIDMQLRAWQSRLEEEYGEELAGIPADELRMPAIEEALPKAVGYLRRAAVLRSGSARGQTLKALAQALAWQDILEMPVDKTEIVAMAQEALSLLPVDRFPGEHAELKHLIERFGKEADPASLKSDAVTTAANILQTPVSTWVERIGERQTEDLFSQSASAVQYLDPLLALRLSLAIEELMELEPEARRSAYDRLNLVYLRRAAAPNAPSADGTPVRKISDSLLQADEEGGNQPNLSSSLLWLAASTTQTNQEDEGLEALALAEQVADTTEGWFARLVRHTRAMLQTGSAVNAYNSGDLATAASRYAVAMRYHLEANQPQAALDILRRLLDVAKPGSTKALESLVAALVTNALKLELYAGDAATYLIQRACRHALAALSDSGPLKLTVVLMIWDVAKGSRFGAALAQSGEPIAWLQDPRTIEREQEMARVRKQVKPESRINPSLIDEDLLLTAYVSPREMRGGGNAAEQLRNMQIKFDTTLDREITRPEDEHRWLPEIESLKALLDQKTVLMLQYIGAAPSGMAALMTLLITREDTAASLGVLPGLPSSSVVMDDGEEKVTSNLLSFAVSAVRSALVSPPGPRVADSRALESLEGDVATYFGGGLEAKLAEFRAAGKDHLCICPHGPLHYYPFHLLGTEDNPMAHDWCVTYLPNLRMLVRPEWPGAGNKTELTAIGVNFTENNVHNLTPISEPEPEALTIAAVYGTKAIIGKAATENAVMFALSNSRRVHIATHGRHNVSAPAFQALYVQPSQGTDGVIHAYELMRLDLRGLDLVTLSACETALGRFDIADNLRGIPAALLISGVATIVGTLWPVETNTATRFFELFYRTLKDSGNKKDAFYEAQKKTRLEFSEYRNWGAFQLIGSWK